MITNLLFSAAFLSVAYILSRLNALQSARRLQPVRIRSRSAERR
jgi:hypothetical protein